MWNSFWRSRDRFSLEQLRYYSMYLTDQLTKVEIISEVNKGFVIEALRSIAELITYGDQHDPSFFEFFMEKQVMGEFIRVLKLTRTVSVPLQLLQTDEVVSFPLYVEAIRFAFHEESMVRTAVRAITLNVYHDRNPGPDSMSAIIAATDEIEDNLYYFSDVVSAGIPDVGRLITDGIMMILIFPLLLPSLGVMPNNDMQDAAAPSLYLLCCILRIVKIKDLANTIAEAFTKSSRGNFNCFISDHDFTSECQGLDGDNLTKEVLLAYVTKGSDVLVLGSLSVLAILLQTKELDESMLDGLGILPQRKQHKKLLLQALVGEGSGEEQLFPSKSNRDGIGNDINVYHKKIKEQYGVSFLPSDVGISPRIHRFQEGERMMRWHGSVLCTRFSVILGRVKRDRVSFGYWKFVMDRELELEKMLDRFWEVFNNPQGLPPKRNKEHATTLLEGQANTCEASGIIRPNQSAFSGSLLLVKKKDNSWRLCMDYKALDKVPVLNKFPIPVIYELLDEVHGAKYFSKLDLKSGYHQVGVKSSDIHKTTFRTHEGHYEYLVMPFGLMNTPSTFQVLMNDIFRCMLRNCVIVFSYDILIYSQDWETCMQHLAEVFLVFDKKLVANTKKCHFAQVAIEYLVHIVSNEGVAMIQARKFVKDYEKLAKPLTALTKIDGFRWTPSAYEKELMAIALAIEHWRSYLLGKNFTMMHEEGRFHSLIHVPEWENNDDIMEEPQTWVLLELWAEYWYNTNFHSSIGTTPFEVVYGPSPLVITKFLPRETCVEAVQCTESAEATSALSSSAHEKLGQSKRVEKSFSTGEWVFLKLKPHWQQSLKSKICPKLAPMVLSKLQGELQLPPESRMHPVFHVSLLKKAVGTYDIEKALLTGLDLEIAGDAVLAAVLATCILKGNWFWSIGKGDQLKGTKLILKRAALIAAQAGLDNRLIIWRVYERRNRRVRECYIGEAEEREGIFWVLEKLRCKIEPADFPPCECEKELHVLGIIASQSLLLVS
ncbi:hypothetical protein V8G54_015474 [Vigna mungo]|uniref:Reverse transcriptase domain-containing protein n=1 Tax=Vigna mungo TaxID=3915 RepID=A0AAQ3RWV9_VIGMU